MADKKRVLFLCTGNSCRSQMAEGFGRHYWGDVFDVGSAGIRKQGLNPLAVKAMHEVGIDISGQHSKTLDDLNSFRPDCLVTVCGHAKETCPVFPGSVERLHVGFDDPPALAADAESEEEAMQHYRRVRDEIAVFVRHLPEKISV